MLAHILCSIADRADCIGRQVLEQSVERSAIKRATRDVLRSVGDDCCDIDMQRREYLLEVCETKPISDDRSKENGNDFR